MIMPGKHLRYDRSLIGIGSETLSAIQQEKSVSELWVHVKAQRSSRAAPISYDWFIMALSFLYAVGAIEYKRGLISIGEHL